MRSLPYVISEKAIADIDDIWRYTVKNWSVEQADRYYELILEEIEYICKKPQSGKSMEDIRKGYRVSKVKSHLIFYKIVDNTVEIVRILHQRMDIDNRLKG